MSILVISGCDQFTPTDDPQLSGIRPMIERAVGGGGGSYIPPAVVNETNTTFYCTDSDGYDIFTRGCVEYNMGIACDSCEEDDPNNEMVWEYFCVDHGSMGMIAESEQSLCPNGCFDGACNAQPGNQTIEYPYEIQFEDNYDINSTYEADVILFTAMGQASSGTGFRLRESGGLNSTVVYTNRVAILKPSSTLSPWGPVFYEDHDGDFQILASPTSIYIMPGNISSVASISYEPLNGLLSIGLGGTEIMWQNVMFQLISNGEDQEGFMDFGYYAYSSEYQEAFACSTGYFGHLNDDVWVTDNFVVRNPHDNFERDEVHLSFFV